MIDPEHTSGLSAICQPTLGTRDLLVSALIAPPNAGHNHHLVSSRTNGKSLGGHVGARSTGSRSTGSRGDRWWEVPVGGIHRGTMRRWGLEQESTEGVRELDQHQAAASVCPSAVEKPPKWLVRLLESLCLGSSHEALMCVGR